MVESEEFNPQELLQSTTDLKDALATYVDENRMSLPEEKLATHERQIAACHTICEALRSEAPKEVVYQLIDDLSNLGDLPEGIAPEDIEDCKVI